MVLDPPALKVCGAPLSLRPKNYLRLKLIILIPFNIPHRIPKHLIRKEFDSSIHEQEIISAVDWHYHWIDHRYNPFLF
jgi:hypothetical protein